MSTEQNPNSTLTLAHLDRLEQELARDAPTLPCACGGSAPVTRYLTSGTGSDIPMGLCNRCHEPIVLLPMTFSLRQGPAKLASVMFHMVQRLIEQVGLDV